MITWFRKFTYKDIEKRKSFIPKITKPGIERATPMLGDLEITIPVYNEAKTIELQIEKLLEFLGQSTLLNNTYIVLADNGSSDGTLEIIDRLTAKHSAIRAVKLPSPGVGAALQKSWESSSATYLGYMDLDFSTAITHLEDIVKSFCTGQCDIVIGSRWLRESKVINRSFKRTVSSFIFNKIMQFRFTQAPTDSMCGFKFLKRSLYQEIAENFPLSDGWFFSAELTIFAEILGHKIMELPVKWTDDPESKVKIPRLVIKYFQDMEKLKKKIFNYQTSEFYLNKNKSVTLDLLENSENKINLAKQNSNRKYHTAVKFDDRVILGTAGWGGKVQKETAYQLVSIFYDYGYRIVDTSTNYPINNVASDFGLALQWLDDFIKDFPELKIYVKVGSMSNTGSPDSILNAAYLELMRDSLLERFKANLYGIGIHWDNRDELLQDKKQNNILHTLEKFYQKGLEVGLSGVKTPRNYDNASVNWLIESKFITNERVVQEYDNSLIYGYGLFKSVNKEQSNEKDTKEGVVNTSDLLTQLFSQGFHGFITGASNESQLRDILRGYANLLPLPVRGLGKK